MGKREREKNWRLHKTANFIIPPLIGVMTLRYGSQAEGKHFKAFARPIIFTYDIATYALTASSVTKRRPVDCQQMRLWIHYMHY